MKKTLLTFALITLGLVASPAFAQHNSRKSDCKKEQCENKASVKGCLSSDKSCDNAGKFNKVKKGKKRVEPEFYLRKMDLTSTQRKKIEKLGKEKEKEVEKIRDASRKKLDKALEKYDKKLKKVLTPEQYARYKSLATARLHKKEKCERFENQGVVGPIVEAKKPAVMTKK